MRLDESATSTLAGLDILASSPKVVRVAEGVSYGGVS